MTDTCLWCDEEILDGEDVRTQPAGRLTVDGVVFVDRSTHVECLARSMLGGWGHYEDHEFWCKTIGDTDGGLSKRESARRVFAANRRGELRP